MTALDNLLHQGTPEHHDYCRQSKQPKRRRSQPERSDCLSIAFCSKRIEVIAGDMGYTAGVLALFYKVAIGYGVAPLVIFMGVGAMTDFSPLLSNPKTLLLGGCSNLGSSPPC